MPLIKISVPAMYVALRGTVVHYSMFVDDARPGPARPGPGPSRPVSRARRRAPGADQVSDAMATDFTSGLRRRINVDRLSAHKISVRR